MSLQHIEFVLHSLASLHELIYSSIPSVDKLYSSSGLVKKELRCLKNFEVSSENVDGIRNLIEKMQGSVKREMVGETGRTFGEMSKILCQEGDSYQDQFLKWIEGKISQ